MIPNTCSVCRRSSFSGRRTKNTNDSTCHTGQNKNAAAVKPKNAMESFLYDFYFKAPKKSKFEKELQV